jgi:hypothetical protein
MCYFIFASILSPSQVIRRTVATVRIQATDNSPAEHPVTKLAAIPARQEDPGSILRLPGHSTHLPDNHSMLQGENRTQIIKINQFRRG